VNEGEDKPKKITNQTDKRRKMQRDGKEKFFLFI
jgi:hypothetical protein